MKLIPLIAFLLLTGFSLASGAPECVLRIDEIPPEGVTQMWSPLFQASWEKLGELQDGELESVVPPNPLITKLEAFTWQAEEVMPEDGYAVYAGPATEEFVRETAASIKKKFDIEIDSLRVPLISQGKVAYGILLRELKFEKKFFRSRQKALEFRARSGETHMVEFFGTAGTHSGDYGDSVKILHYDAEAMSFILSVATNREGENLFVYRPERESRFQDAMERVKQAMENPLSGPYGSLKNGSLHPEDVVKIPCLTIDADTDFTGQLGGALHYAGETVPWRIADAFQVTRFEVSEEGARVRVETGVAMEPFGAPPKPPPVTPRSFVCDRPFYVFLWRAGADWPYLAAWIDGGDSLSAFPE
ncbi:MAG: hypothetical protein GXX91_17730 [Verrucomicrobiaceae bacterium]|nr:hypothetical protein [Verrucomicrobiaceae bacterium]